MQLQEVFEVIREHDRWSRMGEEHLGKMNIRWAERMEEGSDLRGSGPMTLLKAILNDYWADAGKTHDWPADKVDMVMSKLYWCWVAWLEATHLEGNQ